MEWLCSRKGNGLMPVRDLLNAASGQSTTPLYVDDVFSTYLYTGTGATQSINNGINLATKGGLTWIKSRSAATNNNLFDTAQGATKLTHSNTTAAPVTDANSLTSFNSNGFTLGTGSTTNNEVNVSAAIYASWTFRKQPKFFDVVSYAGNGLANRNIAHSLGSTPGCIIIKDLTGTSAWAVYHKGTNGGTNPQNYYTVLNTTAAQVSSSGYWNNTAPTSTQFTVGSNASVNLGGRSYIAYLFADQAGGFGANGTDSAIACGGYTGTGATGNFVSLGWEPQYILTKRTDSAGDWYIQDVMRGMSQTDGVYLLADTSDAEVDFTSASIAPSATGFTLKTSSAIWNVSGGSYIYIAIRRPMKPPTTGTSVFSPNVYAVSSTATTLTTGFPVDLVVTSYLGASAKGWNDRLRGATTTTFNSITSLNANAEANASGFGGWGFDNNTAIVDNYWTGSTGYTVVDWNFRRAPTFFDEVCYTGTGAVTTQSHNLTVAPEMMIVKERSASNNWWVYHSAVGNTSYSVLNTTATPTSSSTAWNNTTPTSSVFSIGTGANVNASSQTYVAYLFATCAGVSKVGTYTGNATGQSIACGFGSVGARFILIKRTDSTGNWYVFDSANGLTSSSSPYLTWNTTNAQTTGNNGVYASSGGFTLGATAVTTTNIATATYIFLAIA